jgi:hypothetical protein
MQIGAKNIENLFVSDYYGIKKKPPKKTLHILIIIYFYW